MQIRDIRLARLAQLLKEHDGNKAALARTLGKAPAQISQWFNGVRTITEDSAREIERKAKRTRGWLDSIEASSPAAAPTPLRVRESESNYASWPFSSITPLSYHTDLTQAQRDRVEAFAAGVLGEARADNKKKSKS